ncbi:MAG: DUF389 domain-containing protein [Solirubrobacterales bacterium]
MWEEVEARTSDETELSRTFVYFMCLAMLIAEVGIVTDEPVLIVGAMVLGPEYGPLAAIAVATVERRAALARRSLTALAVGFPVGIAFTVVAALLLNAFGMVPDDFSQADHPLTAFTSTPNAYSFIVAFAAGIAGVLTLTSAKSGALVGVLVSVVTIPAAANLGLALAVGDFSELAGSGLQLLINLVCLVVAGIVTLAVRRGVYRLQRRRHLDETERHEAGLPEGGPAAGADEETGKTAASPG